MSLEHTGCPSVDVVIPVYRPERDDKLIRALRRLTRQTAPVGRVILMNTERSHYLGWKDRNLAERTVPGLEVHHVRRADFDHAGTRNGGAAHSHAPFLLFMTMDAVPADRGLVRALLSAMEDPLCAVAYARQIPAERAGEAERYTRRFNYPPVSFCKSLADEARLGIKASFCSNVCAMYRRTVFDRLGGFSEPAIFNEDMVFAHRALHAGYHVRYCAEARVIHSHDYGASEQLHRNFDLGASQAMHPEVFARTSSEREGARLVAGTAGHLLRRGAVRELPRWFAACGARYLGYQLGKHYALLPRRVILGLTGQRSFWIRLWDLDRE